MYWATGSQSLPEALLKNKDRTGSPATDLLTISRKHWKYKELKEAGGVITPAFVDFIHSNLLKTQGKNSLRQTFVPRYLMTLTQ